MSDATEIDLDLQTAIRCRDIIYDAMLRMVEAGITESPKYRFYIERMEHYNAIIATNLRDEQC